MSSELIAAENLAQAIRQAGAGLTRTRLAALSQQAHALAKDPKGLGDPAGLANIEAQVDEAAAELWGITDRELMEIRRSLEELG